MSNTNPAQDNPLSLVWLRRDLRLHDHTAFASALEEKGQVQPVFVFDTDILKRFSSKKDRRLTFIMAALWKIHADLKEKSSGLLVVYGRAQEIIPKLAATLNARQVVCAEDFEPGTRKRDAQVEAKLDCHFNTVLDHLLLSPREVLKGDDTPYRVFTPYSKAWRSKLNARSLAERKVSLNPARMADFEQVVQKANAANIKVVNLDEGVEAALDAIGYEHNPCTLWAIENGVKRMRHFIGEEIGGYHQGRDFMAQDRTSMLSPYLRHGIVSIREVARLAVEQERHETWLNELTWREFYAMVLYHFPRSAAEELQEKYRGLNWSHSEKHWQAFVECRTGYPIVDAAMRQLHSIGWMHNRARMIIASFQTKHLLLDWRKGEEHFAQWLMDYELASNVGGWQWAASTGTDAAPYFRIFNPVRQSERFDPKGDYIRHWLPELAELDAKDIHMPAKTVRPKDYPEPIVNHKLAREKALELFKNA